MPGCRKGNEHFVRCLFLWDAGREEQRSLEAFIWETDHQAAKKKGLRHCIDIEVLGEQTLLKAFCRESRQSGCYSFNAYLTAAKHGGFAGSVSDPGADGTIPIMQFNGFHSIRETIAAARACLPATMAAGFRAFPCSPSAVFRSLRIIAEHGRYTGTTIKHLTGQSIRLLPIPLAPLNEQQRIVAHLQDVQQNIDSIEEDKEKAASLVALVKKRILDLAIRGLLVSQDPTDEPASILLDRIREEKEELIKQGKIKRDKKESIIFRGDDNSYYRRSPDGEEDITADLPYAIPDSWEWTTIGELFAINPRNKIADDMVVSFVPMPLIDDGYSGCHRSETRQWKDIKTGFTHFENGDIGLAKITPCFENRKSVIFRNLCNGYGAGTIELHVLRPHSEAILPEYALALLKSERFIKDGIQAFTGAVGQQRVGKDYVMNTYFPLPPYTEQCRIVNMIKKLFYIISSIETAL